MDNGFLAEQAIIGGLLVDPKNAVPQLLVSIKPEMFSEDLLRDSYLQLLQQFEKTGKTDITPVIDSLSEQYTQERLRVFFADCMGQLAGIHNLPLYIDSVKNQYKVRELNRLMFDISTWTVNTQSVGEVMERITTKLSQLHRVEQMKELSSMKEITAEEYQKLFDSKYLENVIKTGLHSIDQIVGYMEPSNLIILAARPGIGKSALAMNIANIIASLGKKVAFYSLEMSRTELFQRLISNMAGLDLEVIRNREINLHSNKKVEAAANLLAKRSLYINDNGYQTVAYIRAEVQLKGIEVVFVDYLQLLNSASNKNNRNDEVAAITRELKMMAQDLDVVVIALSQLNRGNGTATDYSEPSLHHLRDSGSIEQDANMVWFMWMNGASEEQAISKEIVFKVAKNRNGKTGFCILDYNGGIMTFKDTAKTAMCQSSPYTDKPWRKGR